MEEIKLWPSGPLEKELDFCLELDNIQSEVFNFVLFYLKLKTKRSCRSTFGQNGLVYSPDGI